MPLIACPECGKPTSTEAEACPHCGKAFHRTAKKKYAVGCVLMALMTLMMSMCVYKWSNG